jgi:hypothetical protein
MDSLDIANRALFHLGVQPLQSVTENSQRNATITFLYDKVRRAELRRNCWRFSTKRVALRPLTTTTQMVVPALYDATITYMPGSFVADANGQAWISTQSENLGNTPGATGVWEQYFGPMTADLWQSPNTSATTGGTLPSLASPTAYFAGELAYMPGTTQGTFVLYASRVNSNADTPNVPYVWNATTQYGLDDIVADGNSNLWRSNIAINLNNPPITVPGTYLPSHTYAQNNTVVGPDGLIYNSLHANNVGNNPALDSGVNWASTNVPAAWLSANNEWGKALQPADSWLPIFGGLKNLTFVYPIGTGPLQQTLTKNAYRLPGAFLRRAPDDPKAGSQSFLGAPSGNQYDDWNLEGNFIVTQEGLPIILRFVADVAKVSDFDDLFCEGLACRLAMDACETITQSTEKLRNISSLYKTYMGEAREVNSIETGATEPPIDDYISCRA